MSNVIGSPGVQINEIDLSYSTRPVGENVVAMFGYSAQGPIYEPTYITTISEYEQVFGAPANSAERYLYHSSRQILAKTRSQLLVTRLPYEVDTTVNNKAYKHSVLVYPVSSNVTDDQGKFDLTNSTEYNLLSPISILLTREEYDNLSQGNYDWAQQIETTSEGVNECPLGLIVANDIDSPVNNLYEGFYIGLADNKDIDPATGYNSITGIKTVDGDVGLIDMFGSTGSVFHYENWSTVPENRLTFKLYETPATLGLIDTVSEIVIKSPTRGFSFDSEEYNDTLTLSLFAIRRSIYSDSSIILANSLLESYAGSINANKKRVGYNGGAAQSFYIENLVNNPSPYLSVYVNPAISRSDWEDPANLGSAPKKKIRINDSAKNLYSIGIYGKINEQQNKKLGYVPGKLSKALRLLENSEEYPLSITCDAGLSTIYTSIKCKERLDDFDPTVVIEDTTFNDEEILGYNGTSTPGPRISVLHNKTTLFESQRDTVVTAHNTIASLFTEFATLTRKDHVHLSDPLRYIFVEGRNFKKAYRKADSELGGFAFAGEIYWPMAHLYSKISSSYVATYPTWFKSPDSQLKGDVWIPPSGVIAASIVNTSPYEAPAGFTRGVITGVSDTGISPTQKQRDLLYKDGFNAVAVFPGEGIVIFGQKTLLNKPSAFDRLNVRRTFIHLEKIVQNFLKYFVFEPNTYLTRSRLVSTISPVFDAARAASGIYDYQIVCDERNNTPTTIDNNELIVDIYIKPTRTAEFIYVNFYATRTGQDFNELINR